ncbi:hypothetical protein CHCC20375_1165 [Bacillus licheniformis]|nr:hypothetical protein CHCC20375_1165 [Bacillus licheniformis]
MSFSFIGQSNETGRNPCGFFYSCGSLSLKKTGVSLKKESPAFYYLY